MTTRANRQARAVLLSSVNLIWPNATSLSLIIVQHPPPFRVHCQYTVCSQTRVLRFRPWSLEVYRVGRHHRLQ
ncbi:hypothetical protein PF007_g27418 [Phytophthora fragariae]|uniref:Uncharacterized protein n=1 Tax=Phytophthora fragariae TaxID=53985 RepID=A0A6A3PY20_9STRA|nr:hypothetical protein PF003_g34322 [Phytophthora fragariae]KAE9064881.1 hypothetical protein PF006_g30583 [Phytophthora fragariae]KAE9069176.1 hypothetical protein PF007_g27418 [Phytophthora fragariae]KAE9167321.1 hypothetical protein PF004_g28861 [Phytophthora fragariae]